MEDLCSHVEEALHELVQDAKSVHVVNAAVAAFMKEHCLPDISSKLIGYDITSDDQHSESLNILGYYHHYGYCNGFPAFCLPAQKNKRQSSVYLYYNRAQSEWNISAVLNSNGRVLFLPVEEPNQLASLEHVVNGTKVLLWQVSSNSQPISLNLTPCTSQIPLRAGIVDFLTRRIYDGEFCRLLSKDISLANKLMYVKKGPPKTMDRALQKDPDWLLDLNRCTLVFDSPVVLTAAFHVLQVRVEKLGGKICRLKNHFLQDRDFVGSGGSLTKDFQAPPCVHINVHIDDWTFEIMFMLQDFMTVKDMLHKYYEITRANEVEEVLNPVFGQA